MPSFRKILFWCHLSVGVCVALVVIVMSATGVLLAYQKQATAWADRRAVAGAPTRGATGRLPAEELLRRAEASAGATPTAIVLRSRTDAPVEVSFGRERRVLMDPFTGEPLADRSAGVRKFFSVVTAWHRTLGATGDNRAIGKAITGGANLGFLFLVVSGFFLWWPRNWAPAALRNVTLFRRGLSGRARDFNWHNVIGVWSVLPLFLVVLSGVVISYRWAGDLVYASVGERAPAQAAEAPRGAIATSAPIWQGTNALFAAAERRVPGWTSISATLPRGDAKTMTFSIDAGTGGQPQRRASLVLDRATAREVKWEPFAAQTRGRRLRSIFRFAHTGEVLGLAGQTIALLVSLGAVVLAATGLLLSLRRLRSWRA